MKIRFFKITVLVAVLTFSCFALGQAGEMRLQPAIDLPGIGLRMAVPLSYVYTDPDEPFKAYSCVLTDRGQAVQNITLMAYPYDKSQTVKDFAASTLTDIKNNLAIRELKVLSETPIQVAGLAGIARAMEYNFRGIDTSSVTLIFTRSLEQFKAANPLCADQIIYVLSMEVSIEQKESLLAQLDMVVRSISLMPLKSPTDMPVNLRHRVFIKNFSCGLAIRLPEFWWSEITGDGIKMGRYDYLCNDDSPMLEIVSVLVSDSLTAQACGQAAIDFDKKRGLSFDILQQGPLKIAGKLGYQFILRQSETQAAESQPAGTKKTAETKDYVIQIRRLLCVPDSTAGKNRHYAMILTGFSADVKKLCDIMDELTDSFDTLPVVKEMPKAPANPASDREGL
ncbi:MAG TPA: hypothetical protein PLK08_00390 [Phycisphaerae bacterium]|nr:hypothetical protein [Phycisphaerae bacterium]